MILNADSFKKWKPTISMEEILNYLLSWQNKGFNVVQGKPPALDGWTIEYSPSMWVCIRPQVVNSISMWSVGVSPLGRSQGPFGTLEEINNSVNLCWQSLRVKLEFPLRQTNLFRGQPLQNSARLVLMLNSEPINAIYDPFFDDKACLRLSLMKVLGAKFSSKIRIITSATTRPSSQQAINDLCRELNVEIEVKESSKDHHRLIFLSTGRCLSPDISFNGFDNSGSVVQIELPNEKKDLFFEPEWQKGTLLFQSSSVS